jgi:hypothetical protein
VRAFADMSFPELKHAVVHAVRQQWGAQRHPRISLSRRPTGRSQIVSHFMFATGIDPSPNPAVPSVSSWFSFDRDFPDGSVVAARRLRLFTAKPAPQDRAALSEACASAWLPGREPSSRESFVSHRPLNARVSSRGTVVAFQQNKSLRVGPLRGTDPQAWACEKGHG